MWLEIDPGKRTHWAVVVWEDYSIQPDAIFASEEKAHAWVKWQQSLWTEEGEEGIHPHAEVWVFQLRRLQGEAWNSYEPVPEEDT